MTPYQQKLQELKTKFEQAYKEYQEKEAITTEAWHIMHKLHDEMLDWELNGTSEKALSNRT